MAVQFPLPKFVAYDSNGAPLNGGKLYCYVAGTNTSTATFTDPSASTANSYPVVLDSRGEASVWVPTTSAYKFALATSADVALWTVDNVEPIASARTLSVSSGASGLGYIQAGGGAVATTIQERLRRTISVFDFMTAAQIADVQANTALVDVTAALVAAAAVVTSGTTLVFPRGTYLVSFTDASNSDYHGRKVIYLSGLSDVTIEGGGATIKCVNHDIATNGGLMFLWATDCQRITVEGFRFDMTFTGVKNSGSFYPFCGAIIFVDATTGVQAQTDICGNVVVRSCSFKLYHPYGQYATTTAGNDYGGDSNNGYKLFTVFLSGDSSATAYDNQNRTCLLSDMTLEDGHNGYGFWVWAYNDVTFERLKAHSFIGKYSTNAGAVGGAGVPFIRYHQFYNTGVKITDCYMRAKPCNERTTSGFEGAAQFCHLTTNLTGDRSLGSAIVSGNTIIHGNGDSANSLLDYGVYITCYGDINIANNYIDGITTTTNKYGATAVYYVSDNDGIAAIRIADNTFGFSNSFCNNIVMTTGSDISDYDRRLKSLIVAGNTSFSQSQYFLDTLNNNSPKTYEGIRHTQVYGNTIIGTYNTLYTSSDTNSRAIRVAANQSTDILLIKDNIVVDKNTFVLAAQVNASSQAIIQNNKLSGVSTVFNGGSLIELQSAAGTFTPIMEGSTSTGSASATFAYGRYMREGNRCFFDASIKITSAGGAVGNWLINLNDIPYTSKNVNSNHTTALSVVYSDVAVGAGKTLACAALNNSKNIAIYSLDSDAGGTLSSYAVSSDAAFSIWVSGSYEVA